MYVKYCENKPKSEYLVAEYNDYFEVSVGMSPHLFLVLFHFCIVPYLIGRNCEPSLAIDCNFLTYSSNPFRES